MPPKAPAKQKQPSTGPKEKADRRSRSQVAGHNEAPSTSQPDSPRKEKTKCKVCGKEYLFFFSHLKRSETCAKEYDMDGIEEENLRSRRAASRASSKKHYDNLTPEEKHTPEKRAASRASSKKHFDNLTPGQKDKRKKDKQTWYQRNRARILERKALQRKVKLESKEHYDRFMDIKNGL